MPGRNHIETARRGGARRRPANMYDRLAEAREARERALARKSAKSSLRAEELRRALTGKSDIAELERTLPDPGRGEPGDALSADTGSEAAAKIDAGAQARRRPTARRTAWALSALVAAGFAAAVLGAGPGRDVAALETAAETGLSAPPSRVAEDAAALQPTPIDRKTSAAPPPDSVSADTRTAALAPALGVGPPGRSARRVVARPDPAAILPAPPSETETETETGAGVAAEIAIPVFAASRPQARPLPPQPIDIPDRAVRLFVHAPASVTGQSLEGTMRALAELGVGAETRRTSVNIGETHVRFFHEEDAGAAIRIADALGGRVRDFTTFSPPPAEGHLEAWLSGRSSTQRRAAREPPAVRGVRRELELLRRELERSLGGG